MGNSFAQNFIANDYSPVQLTTMFLSLFGTGKYGDFVSSIFNENQSKIGGTGLQNVLKIFGPEQGALIWSALLLKKRILVGMKLAFVLFTTIVSEQVDDLLQIVRALPCLAWHRQQFDMIRPIVNFSNETELTELKSSGIYIAGSVEQSAKSDNKVYDVLLDVSSQRVHISEPVRGLQIYILVTLLDDFKVTKLHQDVAKIIANTEFNNQQLIKALALKTKDILTKLQQLKEESEGELTSEKLQAAVKNADVEKFLYNVVRTNIAFFNNILTKICRALQRTLSNFNKTLLIEWNNLLAFLEALELSYPQHSIRQ